MRTHRLVLVALACLPLACKDGGCGGGGNAGSSGAPSASTTAAITASAPLASASAGHRGNRGMMVRAGGAVGALFRAASQLDLKDEQKTKIEKIATDLREADKAANEGDAGNARKGMRAIHEEMVAGVKAGKIELSKLEPHFANLEREAKERHARDTEALGKLHEVLEPAQRTSIATSVKKTDDERAARLKTQEASIAARAADGGMTPNRRRYERWGRDLTLDEEQKKKLETFIPKDDPKTQAETREEAKKRSDATIAVFEKETFDAKAVPPPDTKRIRQPFDDQVKFFNQLIPILKPEQKEKLAQRLEKQPGAGGMGDHGRPRRPGGEDHENNDDDHEDKDPR